MPQLAPVVLLLAFLLLLYFGPKLKSAKAAKSVKAGAGPKQAEEKRDLNQRNPQREHDNHMIQTFKV